VSPSPPGENWNTTYGTERIDEALGNHMLTLIVNKAHVLKPEGYIQSTYRDEFGVVWGEDLDRDRGQPIERPLETGEFEELSVPRFP
jgi:hypothetical protein